MKDVSSYFLDILMEFQEHAGGAVEGTSLRRLCDVTGLCEVATPLTDRYLICMLSKHVNIVNIVNTFFDFFNEIGSKAIYVLNHDCTSCLFKSGSTESTEHPT